MTIKDLNAMLNFRFLQPWFRYVPPCQSNEFNEQGTPIGVYVTPWGTRIRQDKVRDLGVEPVSFQREETAAESFQREHGDVWGKDVQEKKKTNVPKDDVIDVTFEEVVE